jgi:glycosyltransferase involved in cell wall biosynthesis
MANIIVVWGLWGPYHCRRLEAFRQLGQELGHKVTGISLFSGSSVNQWRVENLPEGVVHINLGNDETRLPLRQLHALASIPRTFQADAALLPSYGHWSLVLNASVRLRGGRVVMMNETHAGTARARGWKAAFKQRVVAGFDAALVGGAPHSRYFASLGLPADKIFTGYDAIDNDYFATRANESRNQSDSLRRRYGLPSRYFLSLGRFVEKKNLDRLIRAYQQFLRSNPQTATHLVMVGSGDQDNKLRALCRELSLPLYDKTSLPAESTPPAAGSEPPGVHFYGFRRIEENPIFYALAEAFVMPSLWEEWGLVVNEAMASGLPVVVSETAGCAEDLMESFSAGEETWSDALSASHSTALAPKIRRNGFVFDPHSSEELGRVLTCLDLSPEMRAGMGEASRQIIRRYSCHAFAEGALKAANAALDA